MPEKTIFVSTTRYFTANAKAEFINSTKKIAPFHAIKTMSASIIVMLLEQKT